MFAKQRKRSSLHIIFMFVLTGGLAGVIPAKAGSQLLLTATPTPPWSYKPLYLSLSDNQTIGGIALSMGKNGVCSSMAQTWRL
jgi:hypothetical protein